MFSFGTIFSFVLLGFIISSSAFNGINLRTQRFSANCLDATYGKNIGRMSDSISSRVTEQERLLADYKKKVEEQKKTKALALERAKSMAIGKNTIVASTSHSAVNELTDKSPLQSVLVKDDGLLENYRKKVAAQKAAKMAAARGLSVNAFTAAAPSTPSVAVVSEVSSVIISNKEDSLLAEYRKKVAAQKAAKMAAARGLSSPVGSVVSAVSKPKSVGTASPVTTKSFTPVSTVKKVVSNEATALDEYRRKVAAQQAAKMAAAKGAFVSRR